MFYLVCYDVVANRRRNRVARLLLGYGLRVQKSVFECLLTQEQLAMVEKKLLHWLDPDEDQVRFYPMSRATRQQVKVLGLQPEREVDDDAFIV